MAIKHLQRGISQVASRAKRYSGELILDVRWIEGYHENPSKRFKQVHGCPHNGFYRVSITRTVRPGEYRAGEHRDVIKKQFICAPQSLSAAVDSPSEIDDAARAALAFADNEGEPISDYAAFDDQGWYVGRTKKTAWPRDPSSSRGKRAERLREHLSGRRDPTSEKPPIEITRVAREIYDHSDKEKLLKAVNKLGWAHIETNRYSGAWWIRKGNYEVLIAFGGPRNVARAFTWRLIGGATSQTFV